MARKSIEERLAQLDAQRAALKSRLGKQARADDTRRKVLIGALILNAIEKDDDSATWLRQFLARELPGYLTRDNDREIFKAVGLMGSQGNDS